MPLKCNNITVDKCRGDYSSSYSTFICLIHARVRKPNPHISKKSRLCCGLRNYTVKRQLKLVFTSGTFNTL
nr:MAG TPA: hypothetical protein [Caudoviricetes sp.]